jgi:hypothetical protein
LAEDGKTKIGYADATVVGWLPSDLSEYFSEFTQEPAPLWHIKYDSAEMGEEDLEEVEVEDAAKAFELDEWCNLDKVMEVLHLGQLHDVQVVVQASNSQVRECLACNL